MSALTDRLLDLLPDLRLHRETDDDSEVMIYGSPGCGKTRSLGVILDAHLKAGLPPDQMLVNAFTRNATAELRRRLSNEYGLADSDMPWVRTIHSSCFQLLQLRPEQTVNTHQLKAFGEESGYKFQGILNQRSLDDPYATGSIQTFGDWCYIAEELRRALRVAIPEIVGQLRRKNPTDTSWGDDEARDFSNTYRDWKRDNQLYDFADMLELVLEHRLRPPIKWMWLDECLPGDSMVALADGSQMPIREIVQRRLAVSVLSYNLATDSIEVRRVVGWHDNPLRGRSMHRAGPLVATGNHPVLVLGRGYTPLEECHVTDRVLQLTDEDVRSLRGAFPGGKIRRDRVASWRRIDRLEFGPRGERSDSLRPGPCTARIPSMEAHRSREVGAPHVRSISNFLWRSYVYLFNSIPSRIHRDPSGSATRQWPQSVHAGAVISDGRSRPSGLVYGRRVMSGAQNDDRSKQSIVRRSGTSTIPSSCNGVELPYLRNQEGTPHLFSFRYHRQGPRADSTIHPSIPQLQTPWKSQARISNDRTTDGSAGAILRYLRAPYRQIWEFANLWFRGMQPSARQTSDGSVATATPCTVRGDHGGLRDMREFVHYDSPSQQASPSPYMRRKSMQGGSELENVRPARLQSETTNLDRSVYCLDVEGNHNFFANGILVKNCQDMTPAQWRVAEMWKEGAERLLAFGDVDQAVFSWAGALPSEVWNRPGHQMYLSHSYRLPSVVHAEAQRIIGRIPIAERAPEGFEPHYEGGTLDRLFGWADEPENGSTLADRVAASDDETWLLLVRNRVFAEGARTILTENAIPFKDRTSSAGIPDSWTPEPGGSARGRAIKIALDLSDGKVIRGGQLRLLMRQVYSGQWDTDRTTWGRSYSLVDLSDAGAAPRLVRELAADPLEAIRMEPHERFYLKRVARKYGRAALTTKPRVEVSTVHGAKGEEADNVAVSISMTRRTYQEYQTDPSSEHRVAYVGATRAKKNLIWIADGQGYRL